MRASSASGLFGGNSNWRGLIWLPTNYLLIQSVEKCHCFLGAAHQTVWTALIANLVFRRYRRDVPEDWKDHPTTPTGEKP